MREKGNLTFFASLSLLSPLLGDLFVLDLDLDLKRMMNIKWDKETHLDPVNLKYELGRKKRGNHFDLDLDFDLLLWLRDLDFDFEVFFPLRLRDLNAEKEEQGGFKRDSAMRDISIKSKPWSGLGIPPPRPGARPRPARLGSWAAGAGPVGEWSLR